MLDFLTNLRLKQLFGSMNQPSVDPSVDPTSTFGPINQPATPTYNDSFFSRDKMNQDTLSNGDDYNVNQRMSQLYQPETDSIDKFNSMINNYPTYKEPSKLRKIGAIALASLSDLGGSRIPGQTVFDETTGKTDFDEAVSNWKNQIQPVEQSANIERQNNSNNRTMAYQTVTQELKDRADKAKAANDSRKTDISQQREQVYALKNNRPDLKFNFSGPNVMVADPTTGKVTDTGISTGTLSDADKISLQGDQSIRRVDEQGNQNRQTEAVRQSGQQNLAETRGWKIGTIPDPNDPSKSIGVQYNEITGETRPIKFQGNPVSSVTAPSKSGTGKSESPTQTRVRQFNSARELANTDPELAQFIKLGQPGSNDFTVTAPSESFFGHRGPTADQYKKIQDAIYGTNPPGASELATSHKTNVAPPISESKTVPAAKSDPVRDKAIALLKAKGQLTTEKNIQYIIKQLGGS